MLFAQLLSPTRPENRRASIEPLRKKTGSVMACILSEQSRPSPQRLFLHSWTSRATMDLRGVGRHVQHPSLLHRQNHPRP